VNNYSRAKCQYAALGVDADSAINELEKVKISIHCWQGDDVCGFDGYGALSGGIQATGSYPGKARNPQELFADIDKVLSFIPGRHKINVHANYAVFNGDFADRDKLLPRHFKAWVDYAKSRGLGLDFNPTFFSHEKASAATLSSSDEGVRRFWVEHTKACIKIAEYFASEVGQPSLLNIWIPDGLKDVPGSRLAPRERFKASLDEALATAYDKSKVYISLESKVFGIGFESYTVGSAEFCILYAAKNNLVPLMDNGHYHPTEFVSDKISSLLLFADKIGLHLTRPVRWDSDHVVLFDDETREIAKELVRNNALDRVFLATDFFDASINRISAWVTGIRAVQKALLFALLQPNGKLRQLQDEGRFSELMVIHEELKTAPFGEIWEEFLRKDNMPSGTDAFGEIREYEQEILLKRV
jgi:L-rhamnose isomerase